MMKGESSLRSVGRLRGGGLKMDFPDLPEIGEGYRGRRLFVFYTLYGKKRVYADGLEVGGSTKDWILYKLGL
jgi:hypothetical protein